MDRKAWNVHAAPDKDAARLRTVSAFGAPAERRRRLLEASGFQRMIRGINATGRRCKQYSQTTQRHGESRGSCSSVRAGGAGLMPARMGEFT